MKYENILFVNYNLFTYNDAIINKYVRIQTTHTNYNNINEKKNGNTIIIGNGVQIYFKRYSESYTTQVITKRIK